jgi:hypothetical protein
LRATCFDSIGASAWRTGQRFVAHAVARCLSGRVVPRRASSMAVSSSIAGSTTLSTRPIARALDADSARPVNIMSIAAGVPTSAGRRTLPPQPG